MDNLWKQFFAKWPKDMARKGLVVSALNEQIPFKAFMLNEGAVVLERTNPDPLGTRFIMLPYDQIAVVKFTDVIQETTFAGMGFVGKLSGR